MADPVEDADVEVELEEAPAELEPEIEIGSAPAKRVEPEEGLEALKANLEAEKAEKEAQAKRASEAENARRQAEAFARQQALDAATARNEKQESDVSMVSNAIEAVKGQQSVLEGQWAQAMANQDFAEAARVQSQMSIAGGRIAQLEDGLERMKNAPKVEPQQPRIVQPQGDAADIFARQLESEGSPRSAAWVREHPDYIRDPQKNARMVAAHNWAISRGLRADSEEYLTEVENALGLREAQPENERTNGTSRQAPPAAPVTRSAPNTNGSRPGTIRLTKDQAEMAELSFPDLKPVDAHRAYAKSLTALKNEGQLH